jgi:putative endonuclease
MAQTPQKRLGDRGEALVAHWLHQRGWQIVAQQWRCRWGELDIVARHPHAGLAFVEVKTRQRHSLDREGRLAITAQKQRKLWQSAQQFLTQHPQWGELPCRFDVALVVQGAVRSALTPPATPQQPPLALVDYIEDAFRLE